MESIQWSIASTPPAAPELWQVRIDPNMSPPSSVDSTALLRRGLRLEYATLGWNVIGFAIVLWAAWRSRSVALAGFGLDSLIEIVASTVVVWELKGTGLGREKRALRSIGIAFFALALYVLGQSSFALGTRFRAGTSYLGMAWLTATVIAMLTLAYGKARTGRALNNPVLQTEGRVTMVDAYLAGSTLIGVLLNALLGWWWADPVAALVIVYYGIIEGRHAWREGT